MMLAFIGSFAVALAAAWLVVFVIGLVVAGLAPRGADLSAVMRGIAVPATIAGMITFIAVLWVLVG